MEREGELSKLKMPIAIGQGFKGKAGKARVGSCTCGFKNALCGRNAALLKKPVKYKK